MGSTFNIIWEHQRSSPKNHHVMSRSNRIISCKSCHIISRRYNLFMFISPERDFRLPLASPTGSTLPLRDHSEVALVAKLPGLAVQTCFKMFQKTLLPPPQRVKGVVIGKKNASMIWWFAFVLLKVSFPFLLISQHQSTWIWYDVWFDLVKSYLSFHELLSS